MSQFHLQISIIRDTAELQTLKLEWDALLEEVSDSPFLTWDFTITWSQIYGAPHQTRILIARDSTGTLIGIAPMIIRKGNGSRSLLRCLGFIGSLGFQTARELDFIIRPGYENEFTSRVITFFREEMATDWDVLTLRQLPSTSPNLPGLLAALPKHSGVSLHIDSVTSPYLSLPGSEVGSREFGDQFETRHQVRELDAGTDLSLDAAIRILLDLNQRRRESNSDIPSDALDHSLQIAKAFSRKQWLHFRLLEIDGKIASARVGLVHQKKLWNLLGAWKQPNSGLSIYNLSIEKEIEWCIENEIREIVSPQDTASQKEWASGERSLINLVIGNPRSMRATVFDQLRSLRDFVRPRRPQRSIPPELSLAS